MADTQKEAEALMQLGHRPRLDRRISLLCGRHRHGQFLIESVSLSLVGGLVGSALGYGITVLAGQAFPDGLPVSPVGLVLAAGVYPALRASRLTPVDAIRAG